MKLKTYGVPGCLEYVMQIPVGKSVAKVHFRGGSIADYTRNPARFTTSRRIEQAIIENSPQFKSGKIVVLHEIEVPDDAEEQLLKKHAAGADNRTVEEKTENAPSEDEQTAVAETSNGKTKVEVADKSEAVEYLKEHFGPEYTSVKLRTKAAFDAACEECGVEFVFTA